MLKFFRRIRGRLLSRNKFSKYLLYAIGEIVLVVIGILLAVQINAWNQTRINAKTARGYYQRLLEDVLLDEKLVAEQITATEGRLLGANQLIAALQSPDGNMETIASGIGKSVSRSDFGLKPTQTTFEDIKSSGNIQLIKDLELRKHLDDYYAFMNGLMITINGNAAGLAPRMLEKGDVIGTGLFHLAKRQDGLNPALVNMEALETLSQLTDKNKAVLLNDAVYYATITSRNLQLFEALQEKIDDMKQVLQEKSNRLPKKLDH